MKMKRHENDFKNEFTFACNNNLLQHLSYLFSVWVKKLKITATLSYKNIHDQTTNKIEVTMVLFKLRDTAMRR